MSDTRARRTQCPRCHRTYLDESGCDPCPECGASFSTQIDDHPYEQDYERHREALKRTLAWYQEQLRLSRLSPERIAREVHDQQERHQNTPFAAPYLGALRLHELRASVREPDIADAVQTWLDDLESENPRDSQ